MAYRMLGIDDEVTVCEHCGKRDLKCTVVLAALDDDGSDQGEVRFGRDCAGRALGLRKRAASIEVAARSAEWDRTVGTVLNSAWTRTQVSIDPRWPAWVHVATLTDGRTVARAPDAYVSRVAELAGRPMRPMGRGRDGQLWFVQ